jgi:hypothetical protein
VIRLPLSREYAADVTWGLALEEAGVGRPRYVPVGPDKARRYRERMKTYRKCGAQRIAIVVSKLVQRIVR